MVWGYPHDLGNALISTNTILHRYLHPSNASYPPGVPTARSPLAALALPGPKLAPLGAAGQGPGNGGLTKWGFFMG